MEVGFGLGHIVLDGDPAPLPKNGAELPHPIFGPFLLCQTAGSIKKSLGMEVGFGLGHIVLDGDPAPLPKKGAELPHPISAHFYCAKRPDASRCHLVCR